MRGWILCLERNKVNEKMFFVLEGARWACLFLLGANGKNMDFKYEGVNMIMKRKMLTRVLGVYIKNLNI